MSIRIRFALATAMLSTTAFAAAPVLDQSAPVDPGAGFTWAVGGPTVQLLAQTVTVGISGRLAEVRVPIGCASGELVVEIRNVDPVGEPGSTVLVRRRYRADFFPVVVPTEFQSLPLGGRAGVRAGDRITIVLRNPTGSCGVQPGPVADPYAGGTGWSTDTINAPSWVPLSTGTGTDDLPFQTFVRVTGAP